MDEQDALADLLTLFVLYFDSHEYGNFGEAFAGEKKIWRWTRSKTDWFYDETWLPFHFGRDAADNFDEDRD